MSELQRTFYKRLVANGFFWVSGATAGAVAMGKVIPWQVTVALGALAIALKTWQSLLDAMAPAKT
jgi:hypothetical protein